MYLVEQPLHHYSDKKFVQIAIHPNLLKKERKHILRSGLPTNQKRRILDSLSRIPLGLKEPRYQQGTLVSFT